MWAPKTPLAANMAASASKPPESHVPIAWVGLRIRSPVQSPSSVAAPLTQDHVVSGLDAVYMNTIRRLAQDFRYPLISVDCFETLVSSSNVKIADAGMEVQNHLGLRRRSAHRLVGRGGAARFGKV